jgi:hypothetical protein
MCKQHKPLTISKESFHAVDAEVLCQTIQESQIEYSIDMGAFTVHHGRRDDNEIVIVEHHNQKPDELSAIWFNEKQ